MNSRFGVSVQPLDEAVAWKVSGAMEAGRSAKKFEHIIFPVTMLRLS
jgi:hypothetical protein